MQQETLILTFIIISTTLLFLVGSVSIYTFSIKLKAQAIANQSEIQTIRSELELKRLNDKISLQEDLLEKISNEIHDNIGQSLSLIKFQISSFRLNYDYDLDDKLDQTQIQISEVLNDLRNLSRSLKGEKVLQNGFLRVIEEDVNRINSTSLISVVLESNFTSETTLENEIQINLYRIFQELIQNIMKHAKAKQIVIELMNSDKEINLIVKDDGVGFDQANVIKKSNGLKNIQNRVHILNGNHQTMSAIGEGTTTIISIPKKIENK